MEDSMNDRAVRPGTDSEGFLDELKRQRWDDHRFYHHSRINQSLHFFSAVSFLTAYALLFLEPLWAPLIGWLLAMCSRQVGHFFFEPKGYDDVNDATHEHKEDIKVGYNLRRKIVLMTIWAVSPLFLLINPSLLGLLTPHIDTPSYVRNLSMVWLALGVAGLLFRTVQLFFVGSMQTGLVWFTKILTDPLHDLVLYCKAPLYLMQGELIDPMGRVRAELELDEEQDHASELG
jgi:hypothetical protein